MNKIFTIVGTRPNLIKVDPELKQEIVWTGQHFSYRMGMAFFRELKLPKPRFNLSCKSEELGKMFDKLIKLFKKHKPNLILVFGDTHSSFAGALAGAYCNITVAHVEAGLRSYRRNMPEEINRVLIDQIASVRFCPNSYTLLNLHKEGLKNHNYVVGDPMFDALNNFLPIKKRKNYRKYHVLTLHRNFNVDDKIILQNIFEAIGESNEKFIFPLHPRTRKNIKLFKIQIPQNVRIIPSQSFQEMLSLLSNAKKVLTDSGGVQKEAYWFQKPVIILRPETEWLEIVTNGAGMLADNKEEILRGIKEFEGNKVAPPVFGANKKIREILYHYV